MIGILGGTFDPVHNGHIAVARAALTHLPLEAVNFIPAFQPPHRPAPAASPNNRLEMVKLAVEYEPGMSFDECEMQRGGPSYTVASLLELHNTWQGQRWCLLLGADAFLGLPAWHDWQRIFELAHIAVVTRPGYKLDASVMHHDLAQRWKEMHAQTLPDASAGSIVTLEMPPVDISATQIRDALARKQDVRGLVPDNVLDYILQQHLYQTP